LRQILGAIVGLAKKDLLKARDPVQLAASIAATSRRPVFALTVSKVTTEAILSASEPNSRKWFVQFLLEIAMLAA
jgi:hypothetical protein